MADAVAAVALAWLAAAFALTLIAAVHAARQPFERWPRIGQNRGVTLLLILVTGGIGALYYLAFLRPRLADA